MLKTSASLANITDSIKIKELLKQYQQKIFEKANSFLCSWILFQWILGLTLSFHLFPIANMETFTYNYFLVVTISAAVISLFGITSTFFSFCSKGVAAQALVISQVFLCIICMYFGNKNLAIFSQVIISLSTLAFYRNIKVFITFYALLISHHMIWSYVIDKNSLGIFSDTSVIKEYGGWVVLIALFFLARSLYGRKELKEDISEIMALEKANENIRLQAEKRARELQSNKEALQSTNWMKTGIAELNDKMRGEQEIPIMAKNILSYLVPYLKSQVAALYLKDRDNIFKLIGSFAAKGQNYLTEKFKWGEGLPGQAVKERKRLILEDAGDILTINSGLGHVRLENIMFLPMLHEDDVKGLLILGSTEPFSMQKIEFLDEASENIAIYFNTALSRLEMRKLLEKTEQQRRELQKQNSEIITQQTILDEKNKQLEESNKHKSVFLANMSHELRTPLNAIIGYSELLLEDAEEMGEEDFVVDLNKIKFAGKHLLSLINGILDLSKIEAGKMDLHLEKFDINEMLNEILVTAEPLAMKNANQLKTDYGDNLGNMKADLVKVRQILLNLLSNAAKFTEKGSVTLRTEVENNEVRFIIVDTGIGLNPQQTDRLFEPFSQADSSTTRKYGGTGLGLTISKKFCEMMGGSIAVESVVDKGSTFTVCIPLEVKASTAEVVDQVEKGRLRVKNEPIKIKEVPEEPTTLLVIDDDIAIHAMMQRFADREGYHLEIAMNGKEGLEMAKKVIPQAIFLDVMMPNIDGWEVLKTLKADDTLADIPVIMISMVDNKSMGFELGASEYLTKPLNLDSLTKILQKYREGSSPSILVVEDDKDLREMIYRTLEKEGYEIYLAENGEQALERIQENVPDLILLDLLMPQMDGFEFLVNLRTSENGADIPVIVVSAKSITEEDRQQLSGNVEKIVQKGTCSNDDLIQKISSLVKSSSNL